MTGTLTDLHGGSGLGGIPRYQIGGMFGDARVVVDVTNVPPMSSHQNELRTAIDDASEHFLDCCERHLTATSNRSETAILGFWFAADGKVVQRSARGFGGAGACLSKMLDTKTPRAGTAQRVDIELTCKPGP